LLALLLIGSVALSTYYYYLYRYRGLPQPFPQGEIGILVGSVAGETSPDQAAAYALEIRALAETNPDLAGVINTRTLGRALPADPEEQHQKALKWGRWLHATLVLRLNAVEGVQEPWVTIVDQPEFSRVEAPLGKFPDAQIANLDRLPLPANMLLLSRSALALAFYFRDSYDKAANQLEAVLASQELPEASPSRSNLDYYLGNCRASTGEVDKAIEAYKRALTLRPNFVQAHNNLGVEFANKGRYDDAIAEYKEALALRPDFAEAHLNLGVSFDEKGQFDNAIGSTKKR
jgi:tetratricopeptide (TPR) repeat protein